MLVKIIVIKEPIPYGVEPPKNHVDKYGDLVLFDYQVDFLPMAGNLYSPVINLEQKEAF